jgi:fatty acid-binding protein DegV
MSELGLKEETNIAHIGATICVHTGPYAIGAGLIKKII